MKRLLSFFISLLLTATTVAQTPSQQSITASHKDYLKRLEALFEEGRHNYADIGNKAQLMRVIEEYGAAINQGYDDGVLTREDEDSLLLYVKYNKLLGDYHYLNSDNDMRSYAYAENFFKKALSFTNSSETETIGEVFYYRFVIYRELGQLFYKEGRYPQALQAMQEAMKQASHLSDDNETYDFISQMAICKARVGNFSEALNDINMVVSGYSEKQGSRYGEALRKKAKILTLQKESDVAGMANPTEEALKCYKEYFVLKKADVLQHFGAMGAEDREAYWMRLRPFVVDCYRLEDADPAFLYDVTLFSKSLLLEYARKGEPRFSTWEKIQKKLKSNDCAVEFIQYEKKGASRLGALVLHKKGTPTFVSIATASDIGNHKLPWGKTVNDALSFDDHTLKNILYTDSTLFPVIWTPELLKAIGKDTKRLYFAADGIFHQLAIEYMLPDIPDQTSLKPENLYRLTSTRQLLNKTKVKRNSNILTCGGIDYSQASNEGESPENVSNDEQAYLYLKSLQARWSNLPGTKSEIDSIGSIVDSRRITQLTDTEATESRIISLANQYHIVHLATHGFFGGITPRGTDLIPPSYDESLSRNVLAFAGINNSLSSNDFDASKLDGILSAREISQLDLSNIDLIVLSACQTGLGYLTDDGIYGLQRGLKNAGVKGMVVSLWTVSDEGTALLMQSFYQHLQDEDIHTAFMHAREDLIGSSFNRPEFYNAFILIDVK